MNQNFQKLLQFAIIGISQELRTIQNNIILNERFGTESIDYPNNHRFDMESLERKKNRLADLDKRHGELRAIGIEAQKILNSVNDAEIEAFVKSYFGS